MGVLEQTAVYYVKSKNAEHDKKKVIDFFHHSLRNLFSSIHFGVDALVLSNSLLAGLFQEIRRSGNHAYQESWAGNTLSLLIIERHVPTPDGGSQTMPTQMMEIDL